MILFSLSISVIIALTPKVSGSFVCCPEHATKGVTPAQHRNRMILKKAFEKQGFANYSPEWWHYRLLNEPAPSLHYYFPVWDGMASR